MAARIPPAVTARFEVQGTFASGSTGTLYRATDKTTGSEGLLKIVQSAAQLTASERGRQVRELEKLTTLHHPSLVSLHAAGSAEDLPWLFRERIEGESVAARLSRGPIPAPEALGIAAQIASGLDELHRAGLLQRDLSPSHVILRDGVSQAVLIDSGLAGRIPTAALFEVSGKPEYVSPEHAQGKLVSFRSDLYSLGAVLFHMVTGTTIYSGTPEEVLQAQRTQPAPPVPAGVVPSNIALLLGQLLSKEPRERPFSAQQVRRALEPFLPSGLPVAPMAGAAAKKTLLGIPSPVAKPRADQTEELSSLDIARAEAVLRSGPPPTPRADATMPLTPMDLARAEAVLRPGTRPPPPAPLHPDRPRMDATMPLFGGDLAPAKAASIPPPPPAAAKANKPPTAPPPPPAASRSQRPPPPNGPTSNTLMGMPLVAPLAAPPATAPSSAPAAVITAEPATAPMINPPAGASAGDLDYDDLAETIARDVDAVNPIGPSVEAPVPAASAPASVGTTFPFGSPAPFASNTAPGVGFGAPSTGFGAPSAGFGAPSAGFGAPNTGPSGTPETTVMAATSSSATSPPATAATAAYVPPTEDVVPIRRTPMAVWVAAGLIAFCLIASLSGGLVGWYFSSQESPAAAIATVSPTPPVTTPPVTTPPIAPVYAPPVPSPHLPAVPPVPVAVPAPVIPPPALEVPPPAPEAAPAPEPVPEPAAREPAHTSGSGGSSGSRSGSTGSSGRTSGRSGSTASAGSSTSSSSSSSSSGGGTGRLATRIGGGGSSAPATPAASPVAEFEAARGRALEAFRARRYPDAEREYLAATRLNPRHAGTWAGLGAARLAQHNPRGAVEAYQRAVTLSPRSATFHVALGRALAESGDRGAARREYDAALAIEPANRDAHIGIERL